MVLKEVTKTMEENEINNLIKAIKGISLLNEDEATHLKFISDSSQEIVIQLTRLNENINDLVDAVRGFEK